MLSPRSRRRYAYRCMHTIQSMELLYTFCLGAIITAAQHLSRLPEDYNIMHYAVGVVTRIVIAWCTMTLLGLWYGFSQLRDLRTKKVIFNFIFGFVLFRWFTHTIHDLVDYEVLNAVCVCLDNYLRSNCKFRYYCWGEEYCIDEAAAGTIQAYYHAGRYNVIAVPMTMTLSLSLSLSLNFVSNSTTRSSCYGQQACHGQDLSLFEMQRNVEHVNAMPTDVCHNTRDATSARCDGSRFSFAYQSRAS